MRSNGKIVDRMDKFIPQKISQFYSELKGKKFYFESTVPSWIEGFAASRLVQRVDETLNEQS